VRGAVQGVGFRPFVYRLACELGLAGWVNNSPQGVSIEVEGMHEQLLVFLSRLQRESPPRSFIQSLEPSYLDPAGFTRFEIRESQHSGETAALVLADIATCPDCLREILDPSDRRFRYPFTNCTNCGPRYSIIESLPYDRQNTTMRVFEMCPDCRREYEDPTNRRFHAQPNACSRCGPQLELWNDSGAVTAKHHTALQVGAEIIREGGILAVKGIGGFHLMTDARNNDAVLRLRGRKHREEKPFAVMYPTLDTARTDCTISELEERLLRSPEAPIVLLEKKRSRRSSIAASVAPSNPYLGVMLPYTPLHHLLMHELGFPVVATSGNISDEPICTDEREALQRLHGIADAFLVHNRPIVRHVDDSVVRIMAGREMVVRRARGYAPLPVRFPEISSPIIAVGAHLKNSVALAAQNNVFISQHIGDLETKEALSAFHRVVDDLQLLFDKKPSFVACDMHPEYLSTKSAAELGAPVISIQHHYAHVAACMAENELESPALGVSWDGTGYGLDDTIWGGEFLLTNDSSFERIASFRPFRLPGGEQAIKQPRRTAIGVLYEIFGDALFDQDDLLPLQSFTESERRIIRQMLNKNIQAPATSSVGRLFDAVASIIGIRQRTSYEGQAAMELEFALGHVRTDQSYPISVVENHAGPAHHSSNPSSLLLLIDWEPMVLSILEDRRNRTPVQTISSRFHNALIDAIIEVARRFGQERIVLTGGCFQNKFLTEKTIERLRAGGFRPYWHQRVPPNDGGIALGQIAAAVRILKAQHVTQSSASIPDNDITLNTFIHTTHLSAEEVAK
jgi:hydrogenase maturation protein HypF